MANVFQKKLEQIVDLIQGRISLEYCPLCQSKMGQFNKGLFLTCKLNNRPEKSEGRNTISPSKRISSKIPLISSRSGQISNGRHDFDKTHRIHNRVTLGDSNNLANKSAGTKKKISNTTEDTPI